MAPRDITGRVLARPLHSPYANRGSSLLRNRWLWIALAAYVLYAGVLSDHSLWNIVRLRRQLADTKTQLSQVQTDAHKLEQKIDDPQARLEHAEALLRAQGMAKPGEIIYRLGGAAVDSTHH